MADIHHPDEFHVGWICAVQTEYVVACELLDEEYPALPISSTHDNNTYTFGRMSQHNVVIACLPKGKYGLTSAALVAKDMLRSFPSIRVGLMVGIAGGAPSERHDIRLGDVVVSLPTGRTGGVIHYESGKTIQNQKLERTGALDAPPTVLLTALNAIGARHERKGHQIAETIQRMLERNARLQKRYGRPPAAKDQLYASSFIHPDREQTCEEICKEGVALLVQRQERAPTADDPEIHYGLIASADRLMRDARIRDILSREEGVLCFEMEAAGLMDHFPCVVIRGICDYSDSHKNDLWQGYAAATAAAYAKELLEIIPPTGILSMPIGDIHSQERSTPYRIPNTMPLARNNSFIGRVNVLAEMRNSLRPGQVLAGREMKLVVLHGLGGIGKTQLAVQHFYLHEGDYDSVWWIDMTDNGQMQTSVLQNMKTLVDHRYSERRVQNPQLQYGEVSLEFGLPERIFTSGEHTSASNDNESMLVIRNAFKTWLSKTDNRKWLLILDNYDNPEHFDISEVLPTSAGGSVIVTTRIRDLAHLGTGIEVNEMENEDGVDLLLKLTMPDSRNFTDSDREQAYAIVEKLGALPLALDQAGAYIWRLQLPLASYLPRLEKASKSMLERKPLNARWKQRVDACFTTWEISVRYLRESCNDAIILLDICAFLDCGMIQEYLFQDNIAYLNSKLGLGSVDDGLEQLFRYSLAKRAKDIETFRIHPLLHTWARERLDVDKAKTMSETAAYLIAQTLFWDRENDRKVTNWTQEMKILPHVNMSIKVAESMLSHGSWTETGLEAAYTLARIAFWHGRYVESRNLMELYLKLQSANNIVSVNTCRAHDYVGSSMLTEARYEDALTVFRNGLRMAEALLGPDNPETYNFFYLVGQALHSLGRLQESLDLCEHALTGLDLIEWDDHPRSMLTLLVGYICFDEQKIDEALEWISQGVVQSERIFGENHQNTLGSLMLMPEILDRKGRYDDSMRLRQSILKKYETTLGREHPDTIELITTVMSNLRKQGKYQEADVMTDGLLESCEKLGRTNLTALNCLRNTAALRCCQGRHDEARSLYKRAYQGYKRALGEENQLTRECAALCARNNKISTQTEET